MREVSPTRSRAYRLLSCLFDYPEKASTRDNLRTITKQGIVDDFRVLGNTSIVEGIGNLITLLDETRLKDLQVEYVRLFDYRPKCPPYEGAYRSEPKRNLIMIELIRLYDENGMECSQGFLPDHISVELDLLRFLTSNEADSSDQKNSGKMAITMQREKEFMNEHLLIWVPDFCSCLNENAALPFFNSLAMVTRDFVLEDAKYIDSLVGNL
jgi:TorA maturation chaperone TorD